MTADTTETVVAAPPADDKVEETPIEPSQNPVKEELERISGKALNEKTEKDKAAFNLRMNAKRLADLGGDPAEVLGVKHESPEEESDEIPSWYRKEKANEVKKTALQLADSISDNDDKELVKAYLSKRIVPSGNAEEDFKFALAAVHAVKNKQVVEEMLRKTSPQRTATGGSSPARVDDQFVPTAEEQRMMLPPYNVSKEQILAARGKEQ